MKKIIGLYGRAQCGKTSTLNLLIDLLEVATTGCSMPAPHTGERRVAFDYNGYKVGVGTPGDNAACVRENCDFFDKEMCDVVFSATRTKGESCHELNAFASKHNVKTDWIKKKIAVTNIDSENRQQAQELLSLIS